MTKKAEPELLVLSVALAWPVERYRDRLPSRLHRGQGVMDTEARAQEGVRNTSGFTQNRQARGVAHLGLHHHHQVPQVMAQPWGHARLEVWV